MDDEARTMSYKPRESDKRYEAVMYTINGVDKMAYFDDSTRAHGWVMKRCEDYTRADIEYAAVIMAVNHENSPSTAKNPVKAAAATNDPVKQLDALIQTRFEPKGFKFYSVKYDVEKTNSLTAPYTAVISGSHVWTENEKPKQMEKFVLYAEYRNGEWYYSHSEGETTYFEDGHVTTLAFDPDPTIDHGKFLAKDLHLKVRDY